MTIPVFSKECQAMGYKNHQPHCVGFTLAKVHLKGLGLIASREIEAGSIILEEKPTFVIEHPMVKTKTSQKHFKRLEWPQVLQTTSREV